MKTWARRLRRRHPDVPPLDLVAAVANRVAVELVGASGPDRLALGSASSAEPGPVPAGAGPSAPDLSLVPAPPGGWGDPWLVGVVHELAASAVDRRLRGAWYTPRSVVEGLVALALPPVGVTPPGLVLDPTCGGGAFLLAALDHLVALGLDPGRAIERVAGSDLDADAVQVSRWALALWWLARAPDQPLPSLAVTRADALGGEVPLALGPGPLVVVGNPPFASPLKAGVMPEPAARFRADRAEVLGPYADLAAIHLLRAVETAGPGSTVALVLPQSVLSGRDTEELRAHLARVAPVRALWAARESLFDAGVRACAVVLDVGGRPRSTVTVARGRSVTVGGDRLRDGWGALAADALGAPILPGIGSGRLGELATATAGFRDEHYALVAACREAAPGEDGDGRATARLVTVGSVDPLWCSWGRAPIRFGGQDRQQPVVDRALLPPRIRGWLDRQLQPKVVLATQSRLLEPWVDREGVVAPATPVIAVHARPEHLDRVAAVLLAPPVVAWAWRRWFGTALAIDALKLAARQVGELPLPADEALWAEAAALVASVGDGSSRAEALAVAVAVAQLMTAAYGASEAVFEWWLARTAVYQAPRSGSTRS